MLKKAVDVSCHTSGLLFRDLRTCNPSESRQIHVEMFLEKRGGNVGYSRAKNHRNNPISGCIIMQFQEISRINAETTPEPIFIVAI